MGGGDKQATAARHRSDCCDKQVDRRHPGHSREMAARLESEKLNDQMHWRLKVLVLVKVFHEIPSGEKKTEFLVVWLFSSSLGEDRYNP